MPHHAPRVARSAAKLRGPTAFDPVESPVEQRSFVRSPEERRPRRRDEPPPGRDSFDEKTDTPGSSSPVELHPRRSAGGAPPFADRCEAARSVGADDCDAPPTPAPASSDGLSPTVTGRENIQGNECGVRRGDASARASSSLLPPLGGIEATSDGDAFLMCMCDTVSRAGMSVDYATEVRGAGLTWAVLQHLSFDELEWRALQYIVHRGAYASRRRHRQRRGDKKEKEAKSPWWPESAGATYIVGIATVCVWRLRRPAECVRLCKGHSVHDDDDDGHNDRNGGDGDGHDNDNSDGTVSSDADGQPPTDFEAEWAVLRAARLSPSMALAVTWFTHEKVPVVAEKGSLGLTHFALYDTLNEWLTERDRRVKAGGAAEEDDAAEMGTGLRLGSTHLRPLAQLLQRAQGRLCLGWQSYIGGGEGLVTTPTLYRGLAWARAGPAPAAIFVPGQTHTWPGFSSFSESDTAAFQFLKSHQGAIDHAGGGGGDSSSSGSSGSRRVFVTAEAPGARPVVAPVWVLSMHDAEREWLAPHGVAYKTTGFDPAAAFGAVPVQAAFVDLLNGGGGGRAVGPKPVSPLPRPSSEGAESTSRLLEAALCPDVIAAARADDAAALLQIASERGVDALLGTTDLDDSLVHTTTGTHAEASATARRRGTVAHVATSAGATAVLRFLAALPGLGPQFLRVPGSDGSAVAHLQA